MTWIGGVGLHKFFKRWWFLVIKSVNIKKVTISAKTLTMPGA